MRAVVLGGDGYVGSCLCARLAELGHEVTAIVRNAQSGSALPLRSAVAAQQARVPRAIAEHGLLDPSRIAELARGAEVLFSCAGDHNPRSSRRALEWVHVAGIENVLAAARAAGVSRVVLLSCAEVTLTGRDRLHWKEDAVLAGQPLGACARTKLLGEELFLNASRRDMVTTSVRPAYLWGAGERRNLPVLCAEGLAGGMRLLGLGNNLLSTAHIDLVVDALIAAAGAQDAGGQAVHVADPETLTAREFFGELSQALSLPGPRRSIGALERLRALWMRRVHGSGPLPEDCALRACHGLLDCLRATTLLDLSVRTPRAAALRELSEWAEQAGGPIAIARLAHARAPLTDADARRYAAIADELST